MLSDVCVCVCVYVCVCVSYKIGPFSIISDNSTTTMDILKSITKNSLGTAKTHQSTFYHPHN
jgi:hypothetical protein